MPNGFVLNVFRTLLCLLFTAAAAPSLAAETTTQVTTYVIKTQEEREQTRWTLTEWLRIKERMKMMDVWLAMFSDPKKDKFQPELMLSYQLTQSKFSYLASNGAADAGSLTGAIYTGQLWLTNLISSTIGVRTLNVDFGIEGYGRQGSHFSSTGATAAPGASTASTATAAPSRKLQTLYYSGDLRIFGRNIQDSSLVLKYGHYSASNSLLDPVAFPDPQTANGAVAGADLQLYILRMVGAEGSYLHFGDASGVQGSTTVNGSYYSYDGFIEVSLLRLTLGAFAEEWHLLRQNQTIKTQEAGYLAGLKIQI